MSAEPQPLRWTWAKPASHSTQPLVEWWVEQVACFIVVGIARRAHRRGDNQTTARMRAIAQAGRDAEQASRWPWGGAA